MDDEDEDPYTELARRLCAAYTSHQMGITVAYAMKAYIPEGQPIGSYWLALARRIAREQSEHMASVVLGSPEKSPS